MRPWILALASLKLTVVLLCVLVVVLASGTIVESRSGAEAAQALVYRSLWLRLLLALFAVNLAASLWQRFPWGKHHVGFALTHGAMLVVLLGAWMTDRFKVEGRLALWEGESASVIAVPDGLVPRALPFSLRLDAFEIDLYPGTNRPAMFRSRVTVEDPRAGASFPAVIEMNHELAYGGWRFYQSSYQQTAERDMTVLAVSRDPGEPVAFAGFVLLVGGMATVLATRVRQRRALALHRVQGGNGRASGQAASRPARAAAALLAVAGLGAAAAAASPAPRPGWVPDPPYVEALRRLVVQHDGRAMPLDTLAREGLAEVAGRGDWNGQDPVAVVLGWSFDAAGWSAVPMVRVGRPELLAVAGLPGGRRHAAFAELVGSRPLLDLIAGARARADREEKLDPLASAALELESRLYWMQGFFQGTTLRVLPAADPVAAWSAPALADPDALGRLLRDQRPLAPQHFPTAAAVERELTYNRARPTRLAWWILAPTAIAALLAWRRPRRWLDLAALSGLLAGFAVMTWGIATRWAIADRIPAANMYESMLFLGWGVGLAAAVAALVRRNRLVIFNAAAMSALAMALVDLLPVDPFIHPVQPVLANTPWLAIHVPIIMVSYSVLALAVLVAHMQVGVTIFAPRRADLAERLQDLLYWYMHVGSILLIAGILTGSMWAASSWGRYWGWDPKEVWSLVAFLVYMAILHGRFDRLIGPFGVAAASIVAFWAILMTYVGVNYILAAGLHSYGFGGGGVATWMLGLASAEAAFLAWGWSAARKQRQALPAAA